jgi:dephospho-CoA kinase
MWKIGLTGSIATGKSTVLRVFAAHGIPIFSADEAVHELYSGVGIPAVESLFPGVARNGSVDRTELSRRIVAEPQKLDQLEAAVHPMVRARMRTFLAEAEEAGAVLAVIDIPLLFETGFDYGFDRVAVTLAPDDVVRERALARPGMSVEKLNAILARQMPQGDKRKRADYIIDTGGPMSRTEAAVEALIEALEASPEGIK